MLNEEPKTKKGIKNPLQRRQTEKDSLPNRNFPPEPKKSSQQKNERKKWKLDEISRAFHRNQTFSFFFCSFSLDQNMSVTDDMSFFSEKKCPRSQTMLRLKNPRGNETSPTTSPPPATTQQKFPPGMKVQERDQPVGKLEIRSGSLPVGVPPHSSQSSFRSCHPPPPSHLTHSNRSHSTHSHSTHSHSSHSRSSHSHSHSKSSQSHSSPPSPYSSYSPVALSPVRPVNCIPQDDLPGLGSPVGFLNFVEPTDGLPGFDSPVGFLDLVDPKDDLRGHESPVGFLGFVDSKDLPSEYQQKNRNQNAMGFLEFVGAGTAPNTPSSMIEEGPDLLYSPFPAERKKSSLESALLNLPSSLAALRRALNEEEELLRAQKIPEIRAASLSRLIDVLFHSSQGNSKIRRVFFMTLRTFTTPKEMVQGLCSRYHLAEANSHVSSLIIELFSDWWLSYYDRDWGGNKEAIAELEPFLEFLEHSSAAQHRMHFRQLSDEINNASILFSQIGLGEDQTDHWKDKSSAGISFLDLSVLEISNTLTHYAFSIFRKLREPEHFAWLMGKRASKEKFKNILELVDLFNRLSSWSSREIVTRARLKDRVIVFEKLVEVAQVLDCHQNFQCARAILSGITASFVARMTKTLKEVSPETMRILKDLEMKLTFEKNFKNLRVTMDTITPPCIPYLGMYQKDLLFLNDGNPDKIGPLINFSKRIRLAEIIFDVSFCQQGSYPPLQTNPSVIGLIFSCPILSEKELFLWSRRVDSKDPEMVIAELIDEEELYLRRDKMLVARVDTLEEELATLKKIIFENRASIDISSYLSSTSISDPSSSPPPSPKTLSSSTSTSASSLPTFPSTSPTPSSTPSPRTFNRNKSVVQRQPPTPLQNRKPLPPKKGKRISPTLAYPKWEAKRASENASTLRDRNEIQQSLPDDPSTWSGREVCYWVAQVAGSKWVEPFAENHILGADLVDMVVDELMLFVDDEIICTRIHREMKKLKGEEVLDEEEVIQTSKAKQRSYFKKTSDFRLDKMTSSYLNHQLLDDDDDVAGDQITNFSPQEERSLSPSPSFSATVRTTIPPTTGGALFLPSQPLSKPPPKPPKTYPAGGTKLLHSKVSKNLPSKPKRYREKNFHSLEENYTSPREMNQQTTKVFSSNDREHSPKLKPKQPPQS